MRRARSVQERTTYFIRVERMVVTKVVPYSLSSYLSERTTALRGSPPKFKMHHFTNKLPTISHASLHSRAKRVMILL
eukprot:4925424-Ditylum_brightwellii.AAC.2